VLLFNEGAQRIGAEELLKFRQIVDHFEDELKGLERLMHAWIDLVVVGCVLPLHWRVFLGVGWSTGDEARCWA